MRQQMEKLHRPHRTSGYIAGIEYEPTTDRDGRPDWTLVYEPGTKARAEHRAFTSKGSLVATRAELPLGDPEPPPTASAKAATSPEPEPTGLERELVSRGVTRGVAAALVATYPEERSGADRAVGLAPGDEAEAGQGPRCLSRRGHPGGLRAAGRLREPGGSRSKGGDRTAQQEQARQAKVREQEVQAREKAIQQQIAAYWAALSAEQQAEIEAAALAEAPPEQRQVYEAARLPSFRRTYLQTLRQEHLRRLLDLPVSG